MTRSEYCELKGLRITLCFDPDEEADEDFIEFVDGLAARFMDIHNDDPLHGAMNPPETETE